MKTPIFSAFAALLIAAPAMADRLVINDDGWTMVEDTPSARVVVIDDDGWSYADVEVTRSVPSQQIIGVAECTQLELSNGFDATQCGVLSQGDLSRLHLIDRDDN